VYWKPDVPIQNFTELRVTADDADVLDDEIFRKATASIPEIKKNSSLVRYRALDEETGHW
jgi:hypothetical protein